MKHVTFDELAQVPAERRRFGWVVVSMTRSTGRGPRRWVPLWVIGFFPSRDDALEFAQKKQVGYRFDVCPFDDGSPVPDHPLARARRR